jgi:hypothetical protein
MVDAMIAITEDLRQTFSRKSYTVENLAAHTVLLAPFSNVTVIAPHTHS